MTPTAIAGLGVLAVLAIVAASVVGYTYGRYMDAAQEGLPVLGTAPEYTLTNQLGQEVASSSFRGKVQLVTFLAPYCTEYCPLIAYNLRSLERVLDAAGLSDRVQIVAFDVDPEHTGRREMTAFLRQYGWDPQNTRWQFLTGPPEKVREVVTGGFAVDYRQVHEEAQNSGDNLAGGESSVSPEPEVANPLAEGAGVDYDVVHNDALVVVDGRGRIRAFLDQASRISDADLMDMITELLHEQRS